jgi:thioester reductase-like protein
MSNIPLPAGRVDAAWLIALVAQQLEIPAHLIKPNVPLTRYGLDSIAAVQVATAIADQLGCDVLDPLLLDRPDIRSLAHYLETALDSLPAADESAATAERMLADSILPSDIYPESDSAPFAADEVILLSGATGFLGAFLLHTLLRETPAYIYCLVRTQIERAGERVRRNLESYGLWDAAFAHRLRPLAGDLTAPHLGLAEGQFDELCREVGEIYHAGAAVNWVFPYEGLQDVNVGGTVELLRLACRRRAKPFHLISSLAVCCSTTAPAEIGEEDNVFAYRDGLYLGYAQSKCVAEALVAEAGARGLQVTIHRPSLLVGDSRRGVSNTQDFLTLLIQGCVRMRAAPDLDWALDCCPVDHAARAIVALARRRPRSGTIFHLGNSAPRRWRELVLWMNLFGYRVRLMSYRDWLARLDDDARTPEHPLHLLRTFFCKPVTADALTLPELYEEERKPRIDGSRTQAMLSQMALACPALDAQHLDRIFASFIRQELLPPVTRSDRGEEAFAVDAPLCERVLRQLRGDPRLRVRRVSPLPDASDQSLITELTSWRHGTAAGLTRYRIEWDRGPHTSALALNVFVKVKSEDQIVLEVGASLAAACGEELGEAFARWQHRLGLAGSHVRELEIYRLADERFRAHLPAVYGIVQDDARRHWALLLEDLSGLALLSWTGEAHAWGQPQIEAALTGLAALHAVWHGREAELAEWSWLGQRLSAAAMAEMMEWWQALANHAARYYCTWAGDDMRAIQRRLIAGIERRRRELDSLPQTLLHGDFNPRNVALRQGESGFRLCAYDWELASLGVSQHDLAEFLCFVLTPQTSQEEAEHYLDFHRCALVRAGGCSFDTTDWRRGFGLALCDLILNRLPVYCLIYSFRRQAYLPRVIRTWRRLYELFSSETTERKIARTCHSAKGM